METKKTTQPQVQTLRRLVAFIDAFADLLEEAGPPGGLGELERAQRADPGLGGPRQPRPPQLERAQRADPGLGGPRQPRPPQLERAQRADPPPTRKMPKSEAHARELDAAIAKGLAGTSAVPKPVPE